MSSWVTKNNIVYRNNNNTIVNNVINNNKYNINFLFSSITYLCFYLPIVIECNKRNIQSIFYIRHNRKKYANPLSKDNLKILNNYIKKYNIIIDTSNILKDGPIICVDGDIYGPYKEDTQSLIHNIDTKYKIYSLQENLNFNWNYDYYKDNVDYILFPNEAYAKLYNKISDKNVYIGNTKFDHILSINKIYKKYRLNSKKNYVIVLFPKEKFIKSYNIEPQHLINIYNFLHYMGFHIIVKTRPKDKIFNNCLGDTTIISDKFPNETLELMRISKLCILFSSSAIEESVMMEIPTIDFKVDDEISKRLEFLYNPKVIQQIKHWKKLDYKSFINTVQKLEPKNSEIYKELKKNYLFEPGNISSKILNFINTLS